MYRNYYSCVSLYIAIVTPNDVQTGSLNGECRAGLEGRGDSTADWRKKPRQRGFRAVLNVPSLITKFVVPLPSGVVIL